MAIDLQPKVTSDSNFACWQRWRSLSTLPDQPKRIGAVYGLRRHQGSRHGARSHRVLQDEPHSAVRRAAHHLLFRGETTRNLFSFSFFFTEKYWERKKKGKAGVLLWQALSEELYDVLQVGPEEKPAAAVLNSVLEHPPSRPPRGSRTLTVRVTSVATSFQWFPDLKITERTI